MSSLYVRDQVKGFLGTDHDTETLVDLSNEYRALADILNDVGVQAKDPWLGIQFIGDEEQAISINATNTDGLYREFGAIYLHVAHPVEKDSRDLILARAEALRDSFRGRRIGDVVIDEVGPPNFGDGATIQLDNKYTAASVILQYYRDIKLT